MISSATRITPPKHIVLVVPYMGARCHRLFQAFLLSSPCIHSDNYRLFFKVGWSHSFKKSGAKQVIDFIVTHLIYKYGVSYKIISGDASTLKSQVMIRLVEKYKFRHNFSSSYNPSSNGQVEAFNKLLYKILKKMVSRSRRDWHEQLPEALWAYRTTVQTATSCMPYNLVLGSEAVLPLKVQLLSLIVAMQFTDLDENTQVRLAKLKALDEHRLMAQQRLAIY